MSNSLKSVIHQLRSRRNKVEELSALVGFDGFIDRISRVVKNRESNSSYDFFHTITEFSEYTSKAAGKSADMELVIQEEKLGGNAPIMANALSGLGINTTCIGAMGYPHVSKVFSSMSPKCNTISICNPAYCSAFEFNDGKLMFADLSPLEDLNWKRVKELIGVDNLKNMFLRSNLIALVNWSLVYSVESIWTGIIEDVLPCLKSKGPKIKVFFDLADPSKRPDKDILRVIKIINHYSRYCSVTLGLNENEAVRLYNAVKGCKESPYIQGDNHDNIKQDLNDIALYIFNNMNIDALLVHPIKECIAVTRRGVIKRDGKFIAKPKISTGGGDNFNAGYCLGQLLGFDVEDSMTIGMAVSGAYVKDGVSPTMDILIDYLKEWERGG